MSKVSILICRVCINESTNLGISEIIDACNRHNKFIFDIDQCTILYLENILLKNKFILYFFRGKFILYVIFLFLKEYYMQYS